MLSEFSVKSGTNERQTVGPFTRINLIVGRQDPSWNFITSLAVNCCKQSYSSKLFPPMMTCCNWLENGLDHALVEGEIWLFRDIELVVHPAELTDQLSNLTNVVYEGDHQLFWRLSCLETVDGLLRLFQRRKLLDDLSVYQCRSSPTEDGLIKRLSGQTAYDFRFEQGLDLRYPVE